MSNLTPVASWDAVDQLEGTMTAVPATWNTPNQALLNRTQWLRDFGVFKDGFGNVGINAPTGFTGTTLHVGLAANPGTNNGTGQNAVRVMTRVAQGADIGGAIALGGSADGTNSGAVAFAQVAGRKANGTANNFEGYFEICVNNAVGTMSQKVRLDLSGMQVKAAPVALRAMMTIDGQVNVSGDNNTHFHYLDGLGKYLNIIRGDKTQIEANESIVLCAGASAPQRLVITDSGQVRPGADNTQNLGASSFRWSTIYAGTGTINTSDATLKTDVADLSAAELATAQAIKGLLKKFRFIDAVAAKGPDARIHVGVIAQDVEAAFVANGLDPERYGLFCRDTWFEGNVTVAPEPTEEDPQPEPVTTWEVRSEPFAGSQEVTRLGIRYEELLAFLIAAL
jgi:Chaperone of endosialidase